MGDNLDAECSLSLRLSSKYKLTGTKYNKMVVQFGKTVKQKYMQVRGKEPVKREQYVDGTVRFVNSYVIRDFVDFIDSLIEAYFANSL
jgi:hypothetical protein